MESNSEEAPPVSAEQLGVYSVSLPVQKPKKKQQIRTQVTSESLVLRAPIASNLFSNTSVPGKKGVPSTAVARAVVPHHSHQKRSGNW